MSLFKFHTYLHIPTPLESYFPPEKTTSQCLLVLPPLARVSIELIFKMPALVIVERTEPTGVCVCVCVRTCVRVALTWSPSIRTHHHRTHLHNASARDRRARVRTNGRVCVCVCVFVREYVCVCVV